MAEKTNLELALQAIEKKYGKGSIMKMDGENLQQVEATSSGCLTLDNALGIGGFPKGRIVEIYGPESSGKTTVALHAVAEVQKNGGTAAFIDAEHALDPMYASQLGVEIENLYISQPDSGEQALEILETLVRSGAIDIVVVDSVAALTPQAEIDGEMYSIEVVGVIFLSALNLKMHTHYSRFSSDSLAFVTVLPLVELFSARVEVVKIARKL